MAVLRDADGIVFVADSQRHRREENIDSLKELAQGLRDNGIKVKATPVVMQYNKRDLPNILSVDTLDAYLNPMRLPRFASTVWRLNEERRLQSCGEGVLETFNTITALVLDKLRREHGESGR